MSDGYYFHALGAEQFPLGGDCADVCRSSSGFGFGLGFGFGFGFG
jgi:hypothetical protein